MKKQADGVMGPPSRILGVVIGCFLVLGSCKPAAVHPVCHIPLTHPRTAIVGHAYRLDIHVGGKGQVERVVFSSRLWRADTSFPPEEFGGLTLHGTMTLDRQSTATTQGKATFTTTGEVIPFTQFAGCA